MSDIPLVRRVRHDTKRRRLTVARVDRLAPKMVRVVLRGAELTGFTSLGFDDHVKLFFPMSSSSQLPEAAMRDFTPRRFDADAGELWIDLHLHEAGPAASWAAQVVAGQELDVGGPRGSSIISIEGIDFHLLLGDETALPAIARRLEELPRQARALVVLDINEAAHGYPLHSAAQFEVMRISSGDAPGAGAERMVEALRTLEFPSESCFAWLAAESRVARAIRRYLIEQRGFDKRWIKAAGYWRSGVTGAHDKISDED